MSPAWLLDPRLRRLAFVAWWLGWGALLLATLSPQPDLPLELSDKTWHVLGFALMTAAAVGFAHEARALLGWAAFALLVGAVVELGQTFVPSRSPDIRDFVADAIGCAVGLVLALLWLAVVIAPLRRRPARA